MSPSNDEPSTPQKSETRLVTAGRDTKGQSGFVNPAVFHGSTHLYPTAGTCTLTVPNSPTGDTALRPRGRCRTC